LITQSRQLPFYRDKGILILFFGSISLQVGINIKKNWRACCRVKHHRWRSHEACFELAFLPDLQCGYKPLPERGYMEWTAGKRNKY